MHWQNVIGPVLDAITTSLSTRKQAFTFWRKVEDQKVEEVEEKHLKIIDASKKNNSTVKEQCR
jgi:hypothetical protein